MDPIGSTYGGVPTSPSLGSGTLHAAADRQPVRETAKSEAASTPERKLRDSTSDKQLGIQRSGTSGSQEFQSYGPDNKRRMEAPPGSNPPPPPPPRDSSATLSNDKKQEDPQVQQQVAQLKAIEMKVKAHEAAHKAAGGSMTGPISYSYTRGPDGKSYVTGGEVPISVSPGKTPQETISKMQQVIQAALAPADPSPQDRAVAGQAAQELQKAQQQRSSDSTSSSDASTGSTPPLTEPKDSAQPSESSSGSTVTNSSSAEERRSKPEAGGNGAIAQASRSYTDPSVTGKSDPFRELPASGRFQFPAEPLTPGTSPQDARKAASSLSPSMITGFGSQQPLSGYA